MSPKHRQLIAGMFALLIASIMMTGTISRAQAQGDMTVTISSARVLLNYQIEFEENFTALSQSRVTLDSSNSSEIESIFDNAMQRLVPQAHLDPSTFTFSASVDQPSLNSNTWRIVENISGSVLGANSGSIGIATFNLGFLSMNVSSSLLYGGVEFNKIGRTYLAAPVDSQRKGTTYYLDQSLVRGGPYSNSVIPGNATFRFNLLDFSWVPKISMWTHAYRPFDSSSTWTLNPKTDSRALPFNVTAGIASPEGTLVTVLTAFINPTLSLTTPPRSWSVASTISYQLPTDTPGFMAVILIALIAVAVASILVDKRLSRAGISARKKSRR